MRAYLLVDVGLLADILQKWRSVLHETYGLDITHYVSLPGYAFDSFLKSTEAKIEQPSEPDLYHLERDNVRGGFTTVVEPQAVANNHHINPDFNPERDTPSHIIYLDKNSLYPTVMCRPLPERNLKKLSVEERKEWLRTHDITNVETDGSVGYWFRCDLHTIEPDVARSTDEFPLHIHHMDIDSEQHLSEHSKAFMAKTGCRLPRVTRKLVGSHCAQNGILTTLPMLQFYLGKGGKIAEIHDIYQFTQSTFLKEFMEGNIKARREASGKILQKAYKVISNSIFGRNKKSLRRTSL